MKTQSLIVAALMLLAGCANTGGLYQLNETTRSVSMPDIANLLAPRDIPYEIQRKGDIAVGYNMMLVEGAPFGGARLTLFFRNFGKDSTTIQPKVSVSDLNGFDVSAASYENFVLEASIMAGSPVPPMPNFQPATTTSTTTGTIRNTTTGSTYRYDANTTSRPAPATNAVASFAQGMAIREARDAADNRDAGRLMLRWANAFWLRKSYAIEPGKAIGGSLHLPGANLRQLPLRIDVDINGELFQFNTKSSVK